MRPSASAFTLALVMAACKSTAPKGSGTKDSQLTAVRATTPAGLLSLEIPTQQIEKYVPPADGSNGVPATMNGIWWTDADGQIEFALSFKHAAWNPVTRTASLPYTGYYTYSFPGSPPPATPQHGIATGPEDYSGYDIIFAPDGKSAHLLNVNANGLGQRIATDNGYTMEWVSDGVFVRHTPGEPDYVLRRIVKVDGTHDVAFPKFLQAFGQWTQINAPAPGSVVQEGVPLSYNYAANTTNFFELVPKNPSVSNFYQVSFTSTTPMSMYDNQGTVWNSQTHIYTPIQTGLLDSISAAATSPGSVQVNFHSVAPTFNPAGSATVGGPTFTGTLANVETADLINIVIPPSINTSGLTIAVQIAPYILPAGTPAPSASQTLSLTGPATAAPASVPAAPAPVPAAPSSAPVSFPPLPGSIPIVGGPPVPAPPSTAPLPVPPVVVPSVVPTCCFQVYPVYGDTSQIFLATDVPNNYQLLYNTPPQVAIRYVGDPNAAPATLNYQLTFTVSN